jgi:hypothetical protein
MPEVIFPDKWWKLSQEDYVEAKTTLKALISKDPDSGNSEVVEKDRVVKLLKD